MFRHVHFAVLASLLLQAPVALGDDPASSSGFGVAPRSPEALELSVAVGSGQSYGSQGRDLAVLNDLGWTFDVAAGWRRRSWVVGAYGSGGVYEALGAANYSYDATAGLQVGRHFPGVDGFDVWVALGLGWHGHWASGEGGRDSHQGLELARLQLGLESSLSPSFTLSPVLGVAVSTVLWQRGAAAVDHASVRDRGLSTSLFAGLQARFDLLGR